MLTEEEKREIINTAKEEMLLMIPDVVGNLIANHAALHKINAKFYKDHPDFALRKDVVQSVVEMTEGKNPLLKYEDILEKSVPEIQRRLLIIKDINVIDVESDMPRDFNSVDLSQNGKV